MATLLRSSHDPFLPVGFYSPHFCSLPKHASNGVFPGIPQERFFWDQTWLWVDYSRRAEPSFLALAASCLANHLLEAENNYSRLRRSSRALALTQVRSLEHPRPLLGSQFLLISHRANFIDPENAS